MCAPGISGRVSVRGQRAHPRSIERQSLVFFPDVRLGRGRLFADHDSTAQRKRAGAFTLLELLIVISIVALLLVLMAPAFTSLKSGTDVTSAAYTIKGVLDTTRTRRPLLFRAIHISHLLLRKRRGEVLENLLNTMK
jgi:prepilin-type N-terminal cleavage/methylation domain-containing protein